MITLTDGLRGLAKLFSVREDQAEDLLRSERAAKLALSRRTFLGAGAALATGAAFGFLPKAPALGHSFGVDPRSASEASYTEYARVTIARESSKGERFIYIKDYASLRYVVFWPKDTVAIVGSGRGVTPRLTTPIRIEMEG